MSSRRGAVIDVGTNSVKLLVAELKNGEMIPVLEDSEQTRLGAGFYQEHRLRPEAIADTARAIAGLAAQSRELGAQKIRVIATSAARDAVNPGDLISAIESSSGLKTEIISGEQEAEWAFRGVNTDPQLASETLLLLDVGGGSTEFILGKGEHLEFRQSFQLGTVRLLEMAPPGDAPTVDQLQSCRQWTKDFLNKNVTPVLKPALQARNKSNADSSHPLLVGTGGTSTILARMEKQLDSFEREKIEAVRLTRHQVSAHVDKLWRLPLLDRKNVVGLPKKRADVILPGVVIYEAVMEIFGFSELRISTRGLRFAVVAEVLKP